MKYFVVVEAMAYPLSEHECAMESAFARHLIELRRKIGAEFDELVLVCASMTATTYRQLANHLAVVDARPDWRSVYRCLP